MGRTQTFDTARAVRAAREVFWRDGYEQASLPELERATGLGRSSLYHAFGSKRGLFDAAVQSYLDEVVRPRLRPLAAESVAPGALAEYLRGLRAALTDPRVGAAHSGCLLLSAAATPIGREEEVRTVILDYRAELRRAMGAGAAARWPESPVAVRDQQADVLAALIVAALMLSRVDPGQAGATIDTALALVDAEA